MIITRVLSDLKVPGRRKVRVARIERELRRRLPDKVLARVDLDVPDDATVSEILRLAKERLDALTK